MIPFNYKPNERGKWGRREQGEGECVCPLGHLLTVWFFTWFLMTTQLREAGKRGSERKRESETDGGMEGEVGKPCVVSDSC